MSSVPNWIESKAVHIYALNEYRWGFDQQALTQNQDSNYPVDIIEDNFIEIGLPGAHSDIGGNYSYNDEDSIQFANNALLARPPLALMAKNAIENGVSLVEELSDGDRKDAGNAIVDTDKDDGVDGDRSYYDMMDSYSAIKPYIEDNSLRASMGLWRGHIVLIDVYRRKLEKSNDKILLESDYDRRHGQKNIRLEHQVKIYARNIKEAEELVLLSEKILIAVFEKEYKNESEFPRLNLTTIFYTRSTCTALIIHSMKRLAWASKMWMKIPRGGIAH